MSRPASLTIKRTFSFSAAHHLTDYHGDCERPHGHTYRLAVSVAGPIGSDGLVVDFVELKKFVNVAVLEKLDHRDLNDQFKNPSAELIAEWIWNQLKEVNVQLKPELKLVQIELWEGDTTSVIYDGN